MIKRNICTLLLFAPSVLWGMEKCPQSSEICTGTMRRLKQLEAITQSGFERPQLITWAGGIRAINTLSDIKEEEIGCVKRNDRKDCVYYEAALSNGDILYAVQYLLGEHKGKIYCARYFESHGADSLYSGNVLVDSGYFFKLASLFEKSEKSH